MRRCSLFLLLAVCACQFSLGQVAPPPIFPTFLASDGNIYGFSDDLGFFFYSPVTGQATTIVQNPTFSQICLERGDGNFLSINQAESGNYQFVKVSFSGEVTPIVQTPGPNYYPGCPSLASDGNYYGSSTGGGEYGDGFLYQLTAGGKFNVFYNFTGKADGSAPANPPTEGSDGNLYFYTSNGLLRYSPTTGLVVFNRSANLSLAVPISPLEASDGNFYAVNDTNPASIVQIQPNGTVLPIYNVGENDDFPIAGLFLTGNDLAVLYPVGYVTNYCYESGNFYNMNLLSLQGTVGKYLFSIGSSSTTTTTTYIPTLYQGGDGSFFGNVYETTITPADEGQCTSSWSQYGTYYSTTAVPITMTLNKTHVLPGGSAELTWQVNNAFSKTMQQCYGFGGLSGKLATSGTATITAPSSGSFVSSIVCGGTETGLATLNAGSAALTLVGPSGAVPVGATVTLTATVTNPGNNRPTGKVEFLYGSQVIASATLVNSTASITISTAGLPPGTYKVTASYPGDANYGPAKSSPISVQLVPKTATTLALTPSTQTLTIGATATLTATATGTSPYVNPSGTVKFLYDGTVLATLPITSQGVIGTPSTVVFTHATSGLPPGTYHVTAQYSGDAFNLPAASAAVSVILSAAPDSVTVAATPNPVPTGSSFSVSASAKGTGTPTGTVTFSAGSQAIASTSLNASGVATVTLPTGTLAPGTYQLTAYYAGDSHNPAATSPAITLTIN